MNKKTSYTFDELNEEQRDDMVMAHVYHMEDAEDACSFDEEEYLSTLYRQDHGPKCLISEEFKKLLVERLTAEGFVEDRHSDEAGRSWSCGDGKFYVNWRERNWDDVPVLHLSEDHDHDFSLCLFSSMGGGIDLEFYPDAVGLNKLLKAVRLLKEVSTLSEKWPPPEDWQERSES